MMVICFPSLALIADWDASGAVKAAFEMGAQAAGQRHLVRFSIPTQKLFMIF